MDKCTVQYLIILIHQAVTVVSVMKWTDRQYRWTSTTVCKTNTSSFTL